MQFAAMQLKTISLYHDPILSADCISLRENIDRYPKDAREILLLDYNKLDKFVLPAKKQINKWMTALKNKRQWFEYLFDAVVKSINTIFTRIFNVRVRILGALSLQLLQDDTPLH